MAHSDNLSRITPRLIAGLGILALGILWTLDNLDVLDSDAITNWWPLIVIGAGIARFFAPRASRIGSAFVVIAGGLLLLRTLGYSHIDLGDLIPIGIAFIGAKVAWDAIGGRQVRRDTDDPSAYVNAFAMMGGVRRQSTGAPFTGGSATAIMGGVEFDLRNAQIDEGKDALIEAFALWGGVEITVPQNWRVDSSVLPLLGSFEDKTSPSASGPVLHIRGAAVMGAVVVKNTSSGSYVR